MKKTLFLVMILVPMLALGQATTAYHRLGQVFQRAPQGGVTAQVVPYASIYVTNTSTGTAATIYSDPGLSVGIAGSVVTADQNGNYGYYAALQSCLTERITYPGGGSIIYTNVCSNTSPGVTSFTASAANWPTWLVPTVTNSTTTPSLSVANNGVPLTGMASQAADTLLMNATGASAHPTAVAMPTSGTNGCAGASDALSYNTTTHTLGCNTIGGTGTVTTTGSPVSGNLASFSGATSITSGNLSGDVTTSGTLAATVVKVNGAVVPTSAKAVATNASDQLIAATLQGTDSALLTSGIVSGTGSSLCTDASGGATTSGCPSYLSNPMTATGDMIVGGASGTPTRLAVGSTNGHFTVSAGSPVWSGTDIYYLNQVACTPATSTDAACAASKIISQPDSNYMAWIQMYSSAGAYLGAVITSKGTTTLSYNVFCTYNCSSYGTITADIYIHHN